MADEAGTEFVGSHEKAQNGYGQNGYQGPSSDLPGQKTRGNTAYGTLSADSIVNSTRKSRDAGNTDGQTRAVKSEGYAPAYGMKSPSDPAKVPDATMHRASKQAAPGSFQR